MNIERCERHRGVDFTGERTPHREKNTGEIVERRQTNKK